MQPTSVAPHRPACSLCGQAFDGYGNNPEPLAAFDDRCCDVCNATLVIPARLKILAGYPIPNQEDQ